MSAWKRYSVVFVITGVCLSLVGCPGRSTAPEHRSTQTQPVEASADDAPRVNGVFTDYRIDYADNGLWSATVQRVSLESDERRLTMTGIDCALYQQDAPALRVQAERGTAVYADDATIRLHFTGEVTATSLARAQRLQANDFRWSSADDRVLATDLRWSGDGFSARADRGEFSTDLHDSHLSGNVHFRLPGVE